MAKLLKCPKCKKHLTYITLSSECTEYEHVSIDDIGDFITVEAYTGDRTGAETHICPKCDFETYDADDFIAEINCDCEHLNSSIEKYGECDIEVCQHCGLVLSNEITELIP